MSLLYQLLGYTPENDGRMSPAQYELLICLTKQQVDDHLHHTWTPIVGSLEHTIALLCSEGLIEEASLEEKFNSKFRVSDMRALLDRHSISAGPKARKSEMIARYLDSIPAAAAAAEVAGVRQYRATDEGRRRIDAYLAETGSARKEMEAGVLACLMGGDLAQAGQRIAVFEARQVFPRGPGIDWSKGMPEAYLRQAAYLLGRDYGELPLLEAGRREVGARLALAALLGETYEEAGERILAVDSGAFGWAVFGNVLRTNPCCGYAEDCDLDDPLDVARLYARMRLGEAATRLDLEKLAAFRHGRGIRILPTNGDQCASCIHGKQQYAWSELPSLPRLPRQWGCACTYAAWI